MHSRRTLRRPVPPRHQQQPHLHDQRRQQPQHRGLCHRRRRHGWNHRHVRLRRRRPRPLRLMQRRLLKCSARRKLRPRLRSRIRRRACNPGPRQRRNQLRLHGPRRRRLQTIRRRNSSTRHRRLLNRRRSALRTRRHLRRECVMSPRRVPHRMLGLTHPIRSRRPRAGIPCRTRLRRHRPLPPHLRLQPLKAAARAPNIVVRRRVCLPEHRLRQLQHRSPRHCPRPRLRRR